MRPILMSSAKLLLTATLAFSCNDDDPTLMDPLEDNDDDQPTIVSGDCISLSGTYPELMALPPTGDNGSYDPTLAGDPASGLVWMIFSRVDGRGGEGQVSTHLSVSEDNGTTWCYQGLINRSEKVEGDDLPEEFSDAVSAHWSHEVPSIAYYPEAPINERWRILWHRYLHVDDGIAGNDDRRFAYGWIATRAASDPMLLASAPEQKLFSAAGYHVNAETEDYNNQIGGSPKIRLHKLHPNLSTAVVWSEPGMQAVEGELYVSLVMGNQNLGNSVVLIKMNPAGNWNYVSTMLTPDDARAINSSWTNFSATDLFVQGSQPYLLVSPVAEIYEGVLLFKLDLPAGQLVDTDGNGPDVVWELSKSVVPGIIQTGVATYDPMSFNTGIIIGDAVMEEPQFRLYATGVIPD